MDLQSSSFAGHEISAPFNKRVYCFTCGGGFLCWFDRYSINVFFVTLQTPATGLNFGCGCLGQILQDACLARNTSVVNLCLLVLDRFIAIVHRLAYITFMTRRRTTRAIVFSWVLTVSFNALKVIHLVFYVKTMCVPFIWLHLIFFEFLPSAVLILRFVSIIFHVRKHDRSTRIVACGNN